MRREAEGSGVVYQPILELVHGSCGEQRTKPDHIASCLQRSDNSFDRNLDVLRTSKASRKTKPPQKPVLGALARRCIAHPLVRDHDVPAWFAALGRMRRLARHAFDRHLGFGRIVIPEKEVPIMVVDLV